MFLFSVKTFVWIIPSLTLKVTLWGYPIHGTYRPSLSSHYSTLFEESWTWWLWINGKQNVSVCRGHELANALYTTICFPLSMLLIIVTSTFWILVAWWKFTLVGHLMICFSTKLTGVIPAWLWKKTFLAVVFTYFSTPCRGFLSHYLSVVSVGNSMGVRWVLLGRARSH